MKKEIKERIEMINNGEVPEGYKRTKLGIIPEEWNVYRVNQIIKSYDLGGNYSNSTSKTSKPLIKMGNIGRGKIDISDLKYISSDELKQVDEKHRLSKGDLLFNTRNTLDLVGKVSVWRNELVSAYYNSNLLRLEFESNYVYDNFFMNYQFNSYKGIKELKRLATGTTSVAAIYHRDLLKCKVIIPKLKEQNKINNILGTWDKAIESKEKLLEKKKDIKKGLMQRLLTGEIRLDGFDDEWEYLKLSDILKRVVEKTTENNQHQILSVTINGIVLQEDYFDKKIASKNNIGYKVLKKNELVFSPMNLWMGGIDILDKYKIGIVSPAYKIYSINYDRMNKYFLKELLKSDFMKNKYESISEQGASIVRRNLSMNDFENLMVHIPKKREQNELGQIIKSTYKSIELLEKEIELLREQKKGLMQLLLTGKVRVNELN